MCHMQHKQNRQQGVLLSHTSNTYKGIFCNMGNLIKQFSSKKWHEMVFWFLPFDSAVWYQKLPKFRVDLGQIAKFI